MSAGINKVLSYPGPAANILFDFLECTPQLPCVSKRMQAACERAANARLRLRLELRDDYSVSTARNEAARICNGRPLGAVLAELMEQVGAKVKGFARIGIYASLEELWERLREMHTAYAQQDPEGRDEAFGQRLLVCVHTMHTNFGRVEQVKQLLAKQREAMPPELPDADLRLQSGEYRKWIKEMGVLANDYSKAEVDVYKPIDQFLTQEKLAARAKKISAAQGPQQSEQLAEFLSALRSEQEGFNLPADLREGFNAESQKPGPLSRDAFLARERIGVAGVCAEGPELQRLWEEMRWGLRRGPARDAPSAEIRTWIYHPDRARDRDFAQIEYLWMPSFGVVPSAIEVLRDLRYLRFYQEAGRNVRLVGLPNQMRALVNLEQLEFDNTTSFDEIPPVLEELPALRRLSITENNRPIRVFPSWLDNKINSGFLRWFPYVMENEEVQVAKLDRFLGLRITSRRPLIERSVNAEWNRRYAGLPHEEFTDIPFNIWFRETFSVPSLLMYSIFGIGEWLGGLRTPGFFGQGWFDLVRSLIFPLIPVAALFGLPLGAVALAAFGFTSIADAIAAVWAISYFSFIINPLIHNTIGRLAEAGYVAYQEEMGAEDPQMIHVRNIPEPQPAAVAVRQIPAGGAQ